jgi:hypothetical protein
VILQRTEGLSIDAVDAERRLEVGKRHGPGRVASFGLLLDYLKTPLEHLHRQLRFRYTELPEVVAELLAP